MKSIKVKIAALTALMVAIAFLLFSAIIIHDNVNQSNADVEAREVRQLDSVYLLAKDLFTTPKGQVEDFRKQMEGVDLADMKVYAEALQYFRIGGGFDEAYIGQPDGSLTVSDVVSNTTHKKGPQSMMPPQGAGIKRPWQM